MVCFVSEAPPLEIVLHPKTDFLMRNYRNAPARSGRSAAINSRPLSPSLLLECTGPRCMASRAGRLLVCRGLHAAARIARWQSRGGLVARAPVEESGVVS